MVSGCGSARFLLHRLNLRWRRFGEDTEAGRINLCTAFRQRHSNDKELETEME